MSETVIVTGASRGIGKACALAFGKSGANVIINYTRSKEKAEELCEEISKLGGRALPFCADVADRKAVDEMIAFAHSNFGSISTLVNNAGIAEQIMFCDITEEKWDRMFAVDVKGGDLPAAVLDDVEPRGEAADQQGRVGRPVAFAHDIRARSNGPDIPCGFDERLPFGAAQLVPSLQFAKEPGEQ